MTANEQGMQEAVTASGRIMQEAVTANEQVMQESVTGMSAVRLKQCESAGIRLDINRKRI